LIEYELDTDDLDPHSLSQLQTPTSSHFHHHHSPDPDSTPLLVGLLDTSSRRSLEGDREGGGGEIDLEEIASKRLTGGGMIDSVANMANSILGAGGY
jgi:sodium-coupled neutral amino acid transporter 11